MTCHITEQPLSPWQAIAEYEANISPKGKFGATATFIGTMRDFNDESTVSGMTLSHYPAMTDQYLDKLTEQAKKKWPLIDVLLIHRVGDIKPAEPIMLIACWSAHRRASLDACQWLIEALKQQAPFWKKETRPGGSRWVDTNTDGH